jgi:hypothetical protein
MLIRCKNCNKELETPVARTVSCGCANMTSIKSDNTIFAKDLTLVLIINQQERVNKKLGVLSQDDISWQETRRQRKVRKLDFEIR